MRYEKTELWPDMITYRRVTVYPAIFPRAQEIHLCGGPDWPDWDREPRARHYINGRPGDRRPAEKPPSKRVADGPSHFWIGPIHQGFGHMVAEFGTRIAPTLKACPEAVLVFSDANGSGQRFEVVNALCEWYGIPEQRRIIVTEPTEFATLNVVPQPEFLDDVALRGVSTLGPCSNYLSELQRIAVKNLGTINHHRSVFVSRSHQDTRFCGEDYLDWVFSKAGFEVFYPERVPLREQIRTYAEAKTLVFSEGSAVHGAQLLGELGNVIVLARRPGSLIVRKNLAARASRLRYIEGFRCVITGYSFGEASNIIAEWEGISVLDVDQLLSSLNEEGIRVSEFWKQSDFEERERNDLRELMRKKARHSIWLNPDSFYLWIEKAASVRNSGCSGRGCLAHRWIRRGWLRSVSVAACA